MAALSRHLLPRLIAAVSRRFISTSAAANSEVYNRVLKTQRPTTVQYQRELRNSISLIGSIASPLKEMKTRDGSFGLHTLLRVAGGFSGHFRILIQFWNGIGKTADQYLKVNDLVYVAGQLVSYIGEDENGNDIPRLTVNVSELNFVAQHGSQPSLPNPVNLKPEVSAEDIRERRRNRLHLWQIFFSSPHEWWDNRYNKRHPSFPDFKHKDTGEALWLQDNDPRWIRQQLELQDARLGESSYEEHRNSRLSLTPLVFDDL